MPSGSQNGISNNPNGRPIGSENKRIKEWNILKQSILDLHTKRVNEILSRANDKEFMNYYISLIKYFQPTLKAVNLETRNTEATKVVFENVSKEFYSTN